MSKIRKSAKGENCQVRIGGCCNFNPETTVFAHLGGGGMAGKSHDIHGAYCCSNCHDVVDRRKYTSFSNETIDRWFYEGVFRTQLILVEKGLIKI